MYVIATERRLIMKDNTLDEFKPLDLNEPNIFEPIDLSKTDIFEPIDFSKFDFEPEKFDKCVEELNKELEIALKNAEKQLFND